MSRLPDKAQKQLDTLLEAFRTGEVETAIATLMTSDPVTHGRCQTASCAGCRVPLTHAAIGNGNKRDGT